MLLEQTELMKNLALQFAKFFTEKNAEGIGGLLNEDFALFDPALKWIKGKSSAIQVLEKQFKETEFVQYEVIRAYQDKNTTILEFKITMDQLVLYGVDFIEWEKNKMVELRCYYNAPAHPE